MSTLPGGPADKAGLLHESLWGVNAILRVIHGMADEVRIEQPGVDGAEFYLRSSGAGREHWQAKRQLLSQHTWTLRALNSKGVLKFFLQCLQAGESCVFASITDAPELRALAANARAAKDSQEFDAKFLPSGRRSHLRELCGFWGGIDEDAAFEFLRRTRVVGAEESFLGDLLLQMIGVSCEGSAPAAFDCLKQLYLESVHQTLTADAIWFHLEKRGIKKRASAFPASQREALAVLTDTYLAGQRAKLIRGQSIPRQAANEILDKITSGSAACDIAVIGSAGSGKSGVILQLVNALRARQIPTIAFRLDRVSPTPTTLALGEALKLAESPALVLSRCYPGQSCVLVVDQLDCVSSTSGRHPDFFDTVAALRDEIQGLRAACRFHLIVACRKFDFENDYRLRDLVGPERVTVEPAPLSENEVAAVISAAGGSVGQLSKRQIELLQLPQNLSLFVDSGLARASRPPFITQNHLFDAYWNAKQQELNTSHPLEIGNWKPIIDRVTNEMSQRQELSVPKSKLDDFPRNFVNAMISSGVLSVEGSRVGFGHESLFDYCFARGVAAGDEQFVPFLEKDEQHLFRRAQLRQVLVYLRDEDFERYLKNVEATLHSAQIRAHLKLLVLELMASVPDPRDEEFHVLWPFIDAALSFRCKKLENPNRLASRALDVFFHSPSLFAIADRNGKIKAWLESAQEPLAGFAVHYLRRQADFHPDRVAELIESFIGRGEPWPLRLRLIVDGHDLHKGEKLFQLFLRLIDDGTLDIPRRNGLGFWSIVHGLSSKRPDRGAEVAARWLQRQIARGLEQRKDDHVRVEIDDNAGVEDVFQSARLDPRAYLTNVLPAILRACEATAYVCDGSLPRDSVFQNVNTEYPLLSIAYVGASGEAFSKLAETDRGTMRPFLDMLRASRLYTPNRILQQAYLTAPEFFADEALTLIIENPKRLWCGYDESAFWISRRLIEMCSPHCSPSLIQKLEVILLGFTTSDELSKDGFRARGHASFNLLSAIDKKRLSASTMARVEELARKFGAPDGPLRGIRSYSIVSPITKQAAGHMSDENWLEAIAKHSKPRTIPNFEQPERGGAHELAGMLREFTEKEPERFARLALRFPKDTHEAYLRNVLYALPKATISIDLKFEVARRAISADNDGCSETVLDLLGSSNAFPLPEDLCDYVKQIATTHPDPPEDGPNQEPAQPYTNLLQRGINTVRGRAADAIRQLTDFDRRYLEVFLPTINHLVQDKAMSVRACVASTLMAVARYQPDLAINLFSRLIDKGDALLTTPYVERFLFHGIHLHFDKLRPFVERMLHSGEPAARQAGARLSCLSKLCHLSANDLAEAALSGDNMARLGAAEIAAGNLHHDPSRAWCERALLRLFNDSEPRVRNEAAGCFGNLRRAEVSLAAYGSVVGSFLESAAFREDPSTLLHALDMEKNRLPDIAWDACERFTKECAAKARDITTRVAAGERSIASLAFRLYAQDPEESKRKRTLALIDQMCIEGLNSASMKLRDFER